MPDVDGGKTVRIILRDCDMADGQLSSQRFVEWVITGLCNYLAMTMIGGDPFTRPIPPGLSTVLVIAESHIAIHTWPETASVRVVIDCCVDFNHNAAADWLKDIFGAVKYEYSVA